MKKHGWNYIVPIGSALALAMILFGAGCEPEFKDSYAGGGFELLKGKRDVFEAVEALNAHRRSIMPLRAGGNCLIEWYDNDGKKHNENPAITLVLYPPNRLYFRGDILGGEAIRLGTNAEEFWFRIKPEVSTYWWGNRLEAQRCRMGGYLSPETLLEALGMVQVDTNWIFIGQGGYDTLTMIAADATPVKRIYVDWRDYLIKKIEYFDSLGQVNAVVEMSNYTDGEDGVVVPSSISIVNIGSKSGNVAIDITLRNINLFSPTKAQLEGKLFSKPPFDDFETIYELDSDCKFIRQED